MKYSILISFFTGIFLNCNTAQNKPAIPAQEKLYTYGNKTTDGIGKYYQGREIAHMMGPGGIDWLNRTEREKEENVTTAIDSMQLKPGMIVADIGAGSGYYSFRMAKKLGKGKVYAVEVQDEMIDALKNEKQKLQDSIVEVMKGDSVAVNLPGNSVDLAIMVDVYHELEYPHEILQSIKKALKPGGRILLIEYKGEDSSVPIKPLHKMTVIQANKEMSANGFTLYRKGDFLPIQHFLMYAIEK
ncbi:MAG: class I SAM-dependent methyltransferase [Chitinophagaceae bacterium]|nr:class I SAM-dependent methyltransferase [Chitinophagaceae bacterium]